MPKYLRYCPQRGKEANVDSRRTGCSPVVANLALGSSWQDQTQIEKGRELLNRQSNSPDELEDGRSDRQKWQSYNAELLQRIIDNSSMADDYRRFRGCSLALNPTPSSHVNDFHNDMHDNINRLEAIARRFRGGAGGVS